MKLKWSQYNIYVPINGSRKLFIFNTLTRGIASIDMEQDFDVQKRPEEYGEKDSIEKLTNLGMVVNCNIDEELLFRYFFNKWRYDKTHRGFIISLTSLCNFSCSYCYESYKDNNNRNQMMTGLNWTKLFKFLEKSVSEESVKSLSIAFFGGEPLLNYEVVLQAAQDLREFAVLGVKVDTTIITNGSLLNKEKAKEMANYIDSIQFTLDGIPSDHDLRRPYKDGRGSFKDVFKNLVNSIEFFKEVFLRISVDEDNYDRILELISYLKKYGLAEKIRFIGFSWIFPTQSDLESFHPMRPTIFDREKIDKIQILQGEAIKSGFKISKDFIDGPCMLVSPNTFAIDEELKVYKCPGFLYQKPSGYIDSLGNLIIDDNFWYESVTLEPSCAYKCVYGPICLGGCRWLGANKSNNLCKKDIYDRTLKEKIKIYLNSVYMSKDS
ncbi:MAG: Anaerobic sulfatase-maturating enzyme [candidate division WS2 bacterium]|uniref:Anaerobic sulfatase-maturating enzyme n=1 Tax=Psychracetigena formicireducens TaxID=2986056 RepID=A0A9E2BHC8_PSYF1|nr:Anaerobic sulfatase-maturating enzyme [Candidatus Psychracetigena formicireducens]